MILKISGAEMIEKKKFDYVVIVLVYRNTNDLEECLISIIDNIRNVKIIVVNAFYDKKSESAVRKIADKYETDFISVENLGYSYGNNTGIEYALSKYEFKHAVISNPDIIVKSFLDEISNVNGDIFAPQIIAASGKAQNPLSPRRCKVSEKLVYRGLKNSKKMSFLLGILINRILRECFIIKIKLLQKSYYPIYAAHGSFVILSMKAIERLGVRVYDENIFLFAEESVLAWKAHKYGLKTVYCPEIVINHKEDGSMKLGNVSVKEELKKANVYFFEKYVMNE